MAKVAVAPVWGGGVKKKREEEEASAHGSWEEPGQLAAMIQTESR